MPSLMKEFVLKTGFDPDRCKIDYRKELNPEQLDVVLHGDGPCLVLAGAGSGKTRTITYRVAYLIENGVAPENILLVTFTNKAAREMLSRVEGLLGSFPKGLWGGTFHSIANRILRIYASEVRHTPNFTILDEEDARDLVKLCVKELSVDTTVRRFPSPANIGAMMSFARNAGISLREAVERKHPNFSEWISTLERVQDLYEARKREGDAMDFDDLLILLRELLHTHPDVRDRLANQFQYILVDEYQDTNVIQADIVRQLASAHGNILVVGDDAQSIYSFRAADIRNILSFPDAYPDAKTFRLVTNYRSTPEILNLANAVIRQNREQFKKDLRAVREGFERPSVVPASNSSQEAQYIAQQMLALREDGVPLSEMAVLFRAAYLSQALEFELMKHDIPYEFRGGMKFFQRAHIKDVVAHLRVLVNHRDEMAWMRVLSLQSGMGLATSGKVIDQLRPHESIHAIAAAELALPGRAARGWEATRNVVRKALVNPSPAQAIRVVASNGYRDYLEAEYPDFMDRLEDLEQLAIFAEGYEDLRTFLEEVSLTDSYGAERGSDRGDEDRAVLSTIHQAKGLEWDAVFVMGLTHGKFPNERAMDEDGGLEEERRLFYVATTRARRQLFLTYPIMAAHDTMLVGQPSQFLEEVPQDLVEEVRLKSSVGGGTGRPGTSGRAGSAGRPSTSWPTDDEITIVLDEMGERKSKQAPGSFLRDIDEL